MVTHDPTPGSSGKVPLVSEVLDRLVTSGGGANAQRSAMFQAALQVCTEELRRVKKGAKPATLATLVERARYVMIMPAGRSHPEPVDVSPVLAAVPVGGIEHVPSPPVETPREAPAPPDATPDAPAESPLGDVDLASTGAGDADPFPLGPDAGGSDRRATEAWPPPPPRAVFEDLFAEMRVNLAEDDREAAPESGGRAGRIALAVGAAIVVAGAAAWFFFVRSTRGPAVPDAAPAVIAQIPPSSEGRAPREPTADVAAAVAPPLATVAAPTETPGPAIAVPAVVVPTEAPAPTAAPVATVTPAPAAQVERPVSRQTKPRQPPAARQAAPSHPAHPAAADRTATMTSPDWAGHAPIVALHFSSYHDRDKAAADAARIHAQYSRPTYVLSVDLGAEGKWYRVMLGDFASADEALAFRTELVARHVADVAHVYRIVPPK